MNETRRRGKRAVWNNMLFVYHQCQHRCPVPVVLYNLLSSDDRCLRLTSLEQLCELIVEPPEIRFLDRGYVSYDGQILWATLLSESVTQSHMADQVKDSLWIHLCIEEYTAMPSTWIRHVVLTYPLGLETLSQDILDALQKSPIPP